MWCGAPVAVRLGGGSWGGRPSEVVPGVLGASWGSWQAVTPMRRPGREASVGKTSRVCHEEGRGRHTSRPLRPHRTPAPEVSSQLATHVVANCELTARGPSGALSLGSGSRCSVNGRHGDHKSCSAMATSGEDAQKRDLPGVLVTGSEIGDGSVAVPWVTRPALVTLRRHGPSVSPPRSGPPDHGHSLPGPWTAGPRPLLVTPRSSGGSRTGRIPSVRISQRPDVDGPKTPPIGPVFGPSTWECWGSVAF